MKFGENLRCDSFVSSPNDVTMIMGSFLAISEISVPKLYLHHLCDRSEIECIMSRLN